MTKARVVESVFFASKLKEQEDMLDTFVKVLSDEEEEGEDAEGGGHVEELPPVEEQVN